MYLLFDLHRPRIRPIDLVDEHNDLLVPFDRLLQDEARLWERSLGGIDEEENALDHRQDALHFGPEIPMAGRIDNVDHRAPVLDRGVLGENGDSPFTLQFAGVHHAVRDLLTLAERPRLFEQRIDKRGLAVVDVSDNGQRAPVAAYPRGRAFCYRFHDCLIRSAIHSKKRAAPEGRGGRPSNNEYNTFIGTRVPESWAYSSGGRLPTEAGRGPKVRCGAG